MTDIKSFQKLIYKKAKELRTLTLEEEIKLLCEILKSPSGRLLYYNDTITIKTNPVTTQINAFVLGKETKYKTGCKITIEEKVTSIFDILHVGFKEWEYTTYKPAELYYILFGTHIEQETIDALFAQYAFNKG